MAIPLSKEAIRIALQESPRIFVTGQVTKVLGLIIEGSLPGIPVGAMCRIRSQDGRSSIPAEVIGLKGHHVVLMPIGTTNGIRIGDEIEPMSPEATVRVSEDLLGRILDGCGNPIDGRLSILEGVEKPLYNFSSSPVTRKLVNEPLGLGVRSIDGFMTCGIGMRMMIMAGSGVGKSTLLGMIARSTQADINVIGLIGERGREVREFIDKNLGAEGLKHSVLVIATSDSPALVRMRAAFVTTTIAEYFRDQGLKVLLMMDSLTRFAMASREVGLALGEPPTVKGYTPSLFSALPRLLERVGTTDGAGSITGLYTVLMEADDLQDPVVDTVRSIVDGHIVLNRKLANEGFYPPIDVLQSLSRVMSHVASHDHQKTMQQLRRYMALYEEMSDYIKMGLYAPGKNPELDIALQKIESIKKFLRQDVHEKTSYPETVGWMSKIAWEKSL